MIRFFKAFNQLENIYITNFYTIQTAYQLSMAGLSRPKVVPARHAIFLQTVFDCNLTATDI